MSQTTTIVLAAVGLIVCCSCSSSLMLMTGGDSSNTASSNTSTSTPTEYKYDFYIQTPEASPEHDLHLADIKIDGVRAKSSQIKMHIQPDRYACGSKTDACVSDTTLGYLDPVGDSTWSAWELNTTSAGQKIFTITTSEKVSKFEISYQRPKYTPGWRIEENGTAVVTESSNRGAEGTPSPVTYTYTIQ